KAEIADLHVEIGKSRRAQSIDREPHDFDIGGGAIFEPEQFGAGLIELGRAMRLERLMAECQPVVAEPRRIGRAAFDLHAADRNGEIGPQAKLAAGRIGQLERAPADFLARAVEKDVGWLKDRWFAARITKPRER